MGGRGGVGWGGHLIGGLPTDTPFCDHTRLLATFAVPLRGGLF